MAAASTDFMDNSFIVEAIIDRRVFSGKVLYLTKWKDSK